ncbi:MAG: hypothetical protein J3Q66DRAFT_354874 [Benniella sp.]|nr:MAG: hypothetical protein J3Q66DRAFT_354874 [Benniella sp.]
MQLRNLLNNLLGTQSDQALSTLPPPEGSEDERTQDSVQAEQDKDNTDEGSDSIPLDAPPTYEQSVSTILSPTFDSSSPSDSPERKSGSAEPSQNAPQQLHGELPNSGSSLRHEPSAPPPPVEPGQEELAGEWSHKKYTTLDESILSSSSSSAYVSHRTEEHMEFVEPAPLRSHWQQQQQQQQHHRYQHQHQNNSLDSGTAMATHLRTPRRLEHMQALAEHAASAPELHLQPRARTASHYHSSPSMVPHLTREIPAPPPRLFQFRSRDPSSVPACPYPFCRKPITLTKTRRQRGVTVWIACGLLFFLNTYWTTQAVLSFFSLGPYQDLYHRGAPSGVLGIVPAQSQGFSVRREVGNWMKGFLGLKTPQPKGSELRRFPVSIKGQPIVETLPVPQEVPSVLKMMLGFCVMAVTAIIRWWLCLTPLMFPPLFDTVHSCPHPHSHPYPEELEHERKQLEKELEKQAREITGKGKVVEAGTTLDEHQESISGSAKELDEKVWTNNAVGPKSTSTSKSDIQIREETESSVESKSPVSSRSIRHQKRQEQRQQAIEAAVTFVKKKELSWRARRALRKAEEKRLREIKATQDIGRYSLLYELGGYLGLDQWRQNLLAPTDAQPEPYED